MVDRNRVEFMVVTRGETGDIAVKIDDQWQMILAGDVGQGIVNYISRSTCDPIVSDTGAIKIPSLGLGTTT